MARALSTLMQRSFGAGEIAPALAARADLELYRSALRTCRNFIIQKHGGAYYRNGSVYVGAVKTGQPYLLKYVYNAQMTFVLECGASYIRFYQNGDRVRVTVPPDAWNIGTTYLTGDLVEDGGDYFYSLTDANLANATSDTANWYPLEDDIYEIPTLFAANLDLLRITQDLHVATLTHQDYPPYELTWESSTIYDWRFVPVSTTPSILPPANLTGTAGAVGVLEPTYVVTARAADTYEESIAGTPFTLSLSEEPTELLPNILTWDAVDGAVEFRVYKDPHGNGTYGFLGTAEGILGFFDAGFAPDFGLTPPRERILFDAPGEYPHTAAYYQQRRVFANSHLAVSTVWTSQTGFPSNFTIRSPLQDDDAVTFTVAGPRVKGIQHLIALERLIMLSDGAEWIVLGDESSGVLTPFDIHPQEKGWSGAAARPVPSVLGSTVIFTQYLSRVVRDLVFNETFTGFQSRDLTIFAAHLFKSTILRQDAQIVPDSIAWFVRADGVLLGMTYLPELEQFGWHRHDTVNGEFEDVCVIPEGETAATLQDYIYVVVNRAGGRYIERFAPRLQVDSTDAGDVVLADSAVIYEGAAATAMTGLDHLDGEVVYAWATTASGTAVQGPFTVASGAITLTTAATKAIIGLPITGQLETLEMDTSGSGRGRAARKRVQALTLIVERTVDGWYAGPDDGHLSKVRRDTWQPAGALSDDRFDVNITAAFTPEGRILLQHAKPSPLTVLGVIPHFEEGG